MRVIAHTERGVFKSKRLVDIATKEQEMQLKHLIQQCAADGGHFTMDTDNGYVVFAAGTLKTAVLVVEE